jgi:hypothetical protein
MIALERRTIGDALVGDYALECRWPVTIVSVAGIRIAGPLRWLDFFAQQSATAVANAYASRGSRNTGPSASQLLAPGTKASDFSQG